MAILYLDNTDLLHIDLTKDKSVDEVHKAIQTSVNSWGNLLIATGGVLQPSKYFYTIISFKWEKGQWKYTDNTFRGEFCITVPLPGSNAVAISHKSAKHGEKTLGAMTSPDGNSAASIKMIQEKAQQWINAVWSRHLHQRNVWVLLKVQFWPRIGYARPMQLDGNIPRTRECPPPAVLSNPTSWRIFWSWASPARRRGADCYGK